MRTTTYFDARPDARFFAADIDGAVVSIRENKPTYGVTDGEVWVACRIHDRLVEHRFDDVARARHGLSRFVRGLVGAADVPTIGSWVAIPRPEYAVTCPVCSAPFARPCVDADGEEMLPSRGSAIVVGAPWRSEPHEVEIPLAPLVHAGRITRHHRALHGEPRLRDAAGLPR